MINYLQLRGWRDICEYLNGCWYKFAEEEDIKTNCPKALPNLYKPEIRSHRKRLYENYLIQFIKYQQHPAINYSRRYYRDYKKIWGWRLTNDWEYKIDYLEKVIIFGYEPEFKHWEPALRSRIEQRRLREERIRLHQELRQLPSEKMKAKAREKGVCWCCANPIVFMMVDCVNCGAKCQ